ncbi:MAG: Omp28-related outer membrane protein [Prevotella sp.]|nr:Omp28-related outer membrane protein [Prevotella sp.]
MKKFSLLLFCILVAFPTLAKRISGQEASTIAQQFMEGQQMEAVGDMANLVTAENGQSMRHSPILKSNENEHYIDYGVHTIDGITYQLYSEYKNLRAKVLPYEENGKYSGDIYIPDNVSYQNMTFKVFEFEESVFTNYSELISLSLPKSAVILNCSNLQHIEYRNGITNIRRVRSCHALENIIYPQSCSFVEVPVYCNNVKSITFTNRRPLQIYPLNSVMWEKKSMPALTDVYFACDIPPLLCDYNGYELPISITPNSNVTIHIPQGAMEVYKRSIWKDWNLVEDQPAIPPYVNFDYCGKDENSHSGIVAGYGDNDVEYAMRIPEEMIAPYKGCKISRIEFYTTGIATNEFYDEDVEYVFLTTRGIDYIAKKAVTTIRGTWMSVELDHPYVITGEELFVGIGRHSVLGIFWANLDIAEDGLWLRVMGDDHRGHSPGEWIKNGGHSDWNHPLPIRAIIEGDKLPTDIVIANTEIVDDSEADQQSKVKAVNDENKNITSGKADMTDTERGRYFCYAIDSEGNRISVAKQQAKQLAAEPKKASGANKQMRVKLRNRAPKLVKSVTLDWEIDGNRKGQQTVETAMLTNHEDIVYIDIPNDIAGRNHTMTVSVYSIDGEPDAIPANSQIEENYSAASSTFFPRKIVMEEATGTWCGWCPRGIVAIEKMNEKYPDNFIAIAVHDDEMIPILDGYQPFFNMVGSYPNAHINRSYWIDPYPFDLDDVKDKGEAQINATAYSPDGKEVQVATETEFGFNDNGSTEYSVAYVLTEDKVGPYAQSNYYSNPEAEHDPNNMMDWWVHQGSRVVTVYNDVARAIYGDYYGVKGLFPNEIKEGETYKNQYVFSLPDNVQNKENLNVVTLLVDSRTGEIMNADRTPVKIDPSGIHQLETDNKLFDVYNTMGMKVRSKVATLKGLPEGIYIVNGKKYVHR